MKTPKELWDMLEQRFNNVHDQRFFEFQLHWEQIQFLDYANVEAYNQAILNLRIELGFYVVEKSEQDLIDKTLNTCSMGANVIAHQLRVAYKEGRMKNFSDLISHHTRKERNHEIILNINAHLAGTKPIAEENQVTHGKAHDKIEKAKLLNICKHRVCKNRVSKGKDVEVVVLMFGLMDATDRGSVRSNRDPCKAR